ncbi:hypothetical protein FRX31_026131, partial [Thalictrum thalictroides]
AKRTEINSQLKLLSIKDRQNCPVENQCAKVPSSESDCSGPPGFIEKSGRTELKMNESLRDKLNAGCQQVSTKEELVDWIMKSAKFVAVELGMTLNKGNEFIDSTLIATGVKGMTEMTSKEKNEDDMEKLHYVNSNLAIGEDLVANDV